MAVNMAVKNEQYVGLIINLDSIIYFGYEGKLFLGMYSITDYLSILHSKSNYCHIKTKDNCYNKQVQLSNPL